LSWRHRASGDAFAPEERNDVAANGGSGWGGRENKFLHGAAAQRASEMTSKKKPGATACGIGAANGGLFMWRRGGEEDGGW